MRSRPGFNYAQFSEVEEALGEWLNQNRPEEGLQDVTNPARNFHGDTSRKPSEYLNLDLKQVLEADVLVLLPGWRDSEGARREVELAVWTGKRFMETWPDYTLDPAWQFREVDISAPSQEAPSPRAEALDEAKALITGDRNNAYGPPTSDFKRTASMANGFGFQVNGKPLDSHHVAIFMILLKMSRLAWTSTKRDSWIDAAGYAGCGLECSLEDEKERKAA
jgi:hypothetical protein